MNVTLLLDNLTHPPVLFFFLGVLSVLAKSDLEIPDSIARLLSLYLMFHIGFKGGREIFSSGTDSDMIVTLLLCVSISVIITFAAFLWLKKLLAIENAGAIAASYGSVSAVTFATATTFLETQQISFNGYMVAGMALMESPAIIMGLFLINNSIKKRQANFVDSTLRKSWKHTLREAITNGSVFLLLGSMVVGLITGPKAEKQLSPFIDDIFIGMLCIYMLDMGILATRRLGVLRLVKRKLFIFPIVFPLLVSVFSIFISSLFEFSIGNALLFTVLGSSASYIAVPAAMRSAVPQANLSLLLPLSLGITFSFNISIGIPLYYYFISILL